MIVRPLSRPATLAVACARHADEWRSSRAGGNEAPPPPVATPSVTLSHDRAPLGSPLDITYKFVVADDARFAEDYRVMVHVVDADEELMWTDDHDPPTPTTQWKPGQTIEYTRTVFVPVYPYVGEASIHVGLYSTTNQKRLTLAGEDVGPARLQGRADPAAAADRERVHGLQGRLAPGRSRRAQRVGRVAVDEERGDAGVQEPEEGLAVLSRRRQPRQRVQRGAAGQGQPRRPGGRRVHAQAERAGAAEDSAQGRRSWARTTWPSSSSRSTRPSCPRS